VIDIQQRLGDAMPNKVLNRVLQNAVLLARAAGALEIPVVHTEQYRRVLAQRIRWSRRLARQDRDDVKTSFSCAGCLCSWIRSTPMMTAGRSCWSAWKPISACCRRRSIWRRGFRSVRR